MEKPTTHVRETTKHQTVYILPKVGEVIQEEERNI